MTEVEVEQLRVLDLDTLSLGLPGVTPALGRTHVEACMVRLQNQGHATGQGLSISGDLGEEKAKLNWAGHVDVQMLNAYNDDEVTTESAAYGVAFLIIINMTSYTIIRKSKKGTGFDYWLGRNDDDVDIFADSARLEVSGIRRANSDAEFDRRVRDKVLQTAPTDGRNLPAYIMVTDFAIPRTRVVLK